MAVRGGGKAGKKHHPERVHPREYAICWVRNCRRCKGDNPFGPAPRPTLADLSEIAPQPS
jgi:hypothetical protein